MKFSIYTQQRNKPYFAVGCKTQNQLKQYFRPPQQYECVNARLTIILSHSKLQVFWEGQTLKIFQHYRQINMPIEGYSTNLYCFPQVEKMTKVSFKFESYIIRCLVRIWSTWNTDTCKVRSKIQVTERNLK